MRPANLRQNPSFPSTTCTELQKNTSNPPNHFPQKKQTHNASPTPTPAYFPTTRAVVISENAACSRSQSMMLPLSAVALCSGFSNPLCGLGCNTPDPWIQMVGNASSHCYYWLYTSTPLQMRKSPMLAGLRSAKPIEVWQGESHEYFWAPELHFWPQPYNTYYIYVVNSGSKVQVLQSTSGEPDGPFEDKGFVAENAIDPNVLHHPNGKKYLLVKGDRMLLTELASPWNTTGPSLALPLLKCTKPGKEQWYEAPATWVQAGKVWLMYSRCNTGPDYELMLAYCADTDDVMDSAS